jgi:ElaB/YqjD/DUF883 family membrane-anchored ribosome-binding protein
VPARAVDKETSMTQQKADYQRDYSGADGIRSKDRRLYLADTTTDRVQRATDYAQDLAGKVAEQARAFGDKAQEAITAFRPYVEKSMKGRPMATLAAASVIGFVLGALWKK